MQENTLTYEGIKSFLHESLQTLPLYVFDEIDSTNTEAKRRITKEGITNALFVSNSQTAGRGRSGHTFYSPKDSGIYMSYVFTPSEGIKAAEHATTKAGVCVAKAIEDLYHITPSIKWVNDIYIGDKKVCGILAEAVLGEKINTGTIVVGIGINISTNDFPDDIKDIAGCISDNQNISRNKIVAHVINSFSEETKNICDNSYIKYYRQHSMLTGNEITFYKNDEMMKATCLDIDDEAGLVVKLESGEIQTLRNGEVFTIRKV